MITILIFGAIVFILSLIFEKSNKRGLSKIIDKFKSSSISALKVIGWGIVILIGVALFFIICRYLILGDISGFFK